MILEGYGIQLKRLRQEDIELVRYWRNSYLVRPFMEYREYITPSMQQTWFNSINNIYNNYFIITVDKKPIGLISGSKINWEEGVTENGGIFIWASDFKETFYPSKASLLLTDLSFYLGMKRTYIKVLRDNTKSINYNKLLGYKLCEGQDDVVNQLYYLSSENYFKSVGLIRKVIDAEGPIKLIIDDKKDASSQFLQTRLKETVNEYSNMIQISYT